MSTVIQLAIVLGIMVLVHELGHFIVAKLCRVRVEVFSIGFGTRLFGFKRGDTDYRLSLLPLGGYVKMSGEMPGETKSDDPGELENHPRWQRVLIALAGPFFNFLLAIALMTGVYMVHNEVQAYLNGPAHVDYISQNTPAARTGIQGGDTIVHYDTVENPTWDQVAIRSLLNINQNIAFSYIHNGQRINTKLLVEAKGGAENFALDDLGLVPVMQGTPVQVDSLEPNMPAAAAGLKPGDKVAAIDGHQLHSVPALLAYLQDQAGKPTDLTILRNGQTLPIHLTPKLADIGDGTKDYRLGFSYLPPPVKVERLPFTQAMVASWKFNKKGSMLIVEVLKRMFTRQVSVRSLSGPIGIGQQIHEAVDMPGWMPIIGLMAYISLNLGIFNLLPIPILDGGMILFLIIESILRRDVNQQFKERVYQVAFVCIILFAAFVIFNDITKLSIFTKVKP
ncbi:RIP metalloprotease RseP [Edaphobacter dinghuensis]|uniref:Zinc metalloprotease n=1 Tax=Edaphobacter dinghuensis TaxID=1560005 RepID=A0A917HLT2_9BACT|nr:RIP metalloprotease RseP [Edaphobacter dinghuensis]GGG82872.1 putative zinc metalloprotease [Edaphobacter dinghuensis]